MVRIGGNEGDGGSAHLVQLYPLSSGDTLDGVIVKVQPPSAPANRKLHHVPCDLVLSIDVSGSMDSPAPLPVTPGETQEDTGLSVLDLVKHAARTILETLDAKDRLGIVTFSARTKVISPFVTVLSRPGLTTGTGAATPHAHDSRE
jgi:hypothetical protein